MISFSRIVGVFGFWLTRASSVFLISSSFASPTKRCEMFTNWISEKDVKATHTEMKNSILFDNFRIGYAPSFNLSRRKTNSLTLASNRYAHSLLYGLVRDVIPLFCRRLVRASGKTKDSIHISYTISFESIYSDSLSNLCLIPCRMSDQ